MMENLKKMFHTFVFWILVSFIFGMAAGGYVIYSFNEWQLARNEKQGSIIIKIGGVDCIYDLTKRN